MSRESFVFYSSFYNAIKALPSKEEKVKLFEAICEYAIENNEVELDGTTAAMFMLVKPQIDANNRRYENGKKGGRPSKKETETEPNNNQKETETKPKGNQTETKPEPNVNVNVNVNENDNDINEESSSSKAKKSTEPVKAKRISRKDQLTEYVESLTLQPETKDILYKWIFSIGLKGNVTVDQLRDKLKDIWTVHNDENLVRQSINQSYLSNWFSFYPVKQAQTNSQVSKPTPTVKPTATPEKSSSAPQTMTIDGIDFIVY